LQSYLPSDILMHISYSHTSDILMHISNSQNLPSDNLLHFLCVHISHPTTSNISVEVIFTIRHPHAYQLQSYKPSDSLLHFLCVYISHQTASSIPVAVKIYHQTASSISVEVKFTNQTASCFSFAFI
jgi:hypothetical protein